MVVVLWAGSWWMLSDAAGGVGECATWSKRWLQPARGAPTPSTQALLAKLADSRPPCAHAALHTRPAAGRTPTTPCWASLT